MNRLFVSLYTLIALSVIVIGWGIDQLWRTYGPRPDDLRQGRDLVRVVEAELLERDADGQREYVGRLNSLMDSTLRLYRVEELADSEQRESIMEGGLVSIEDKQQGALLFKRVGESPWILSVRTPPRPDAGNGYAFLLVIFYAALAIIIYLWVWNLSRDLRKLVRHTRTLGYREDAAPIQLNPGSPVHHLATAFNRMSNRINGLIRSHKEITYAVSHELRTPLARMKFALEMIGYHAENANAAAHLAGIKQDVAEMDQLVNELLTYAAFEEQQRSLDVKPGDLESLVTDVVRRAERINPKNVRITIEDRLQGADTYCDWPLIERALLNVIQNAMQYAHAHIHIALQRSEACSMVVIDDDGEGIPEAERERIFDSFVRLRQHGERDKAGFGLGLAIVRQIMRRHDGDIRAEASPAGGARFVLSWPRNSKFQNR